MPCIAAAIDFRQKEKRNGLQTKRSIDTSSVSRSFSALIITHQLLIFRCRSLSNVWQRKQVADGMTSTIPSVITPATGNKQRNRRFSFGGADFIYYKPSEQSTFFTAYPECNGYNHFKVVNVITDTIRLPDISHRIGFIQFIVLIDYPYRRTLHENTPNRSAISNCIIHTGAVGIVTAPVSLIVIMPLLIIPLFYDDYLLFLLFASRYFLSSFHQFVHIFGNFIIGYPCISLCRSNIGVSHHLGDTFNGYICRNQKSAEAVPTLVIGQVFLFPYGYSQFVNLKP